MATQTTTKDFVTQKDLEKFGDNLHKRIVSDFSEVIDALIVRMDERFNKIEERLDRLEQNFERLQSTLDAFLKRLDDIEKDNAARDHQFERLMRWAEKVAAKTGIKLEY